MALFRTANPALNAQTFASTSTGAGETMALDGTVNKTGILLLCVVATAAVSWNIFLHSATPEAVLPLAVVVALGGFVVALVTIFQKTWAPVTAPLYALLEGLVLGGVSALLEQRFPGIAIRAVGLTFGVLLVMLVVYRSGMVRATENFKLGVFAATGGISVFYLVQFVLGFFGIRFVAVNSAGAIGIGFSVFVVIIAAFNLVIDFDFIEGGSRAGAPKYMEWYGAFALMVTLIWLYFEILRLLSKLRSRR